jgi:hypothetical protein
VHPTITETLRGLRRILAEVVAPEVQAEYPAEVLRTVLAELELLEHAWSRVLPFLHWDNAATAALLAEIEPYLAPPLAGRLRAVSEMAPIDEWDFEAVHERNQVLRGLLAESVPLLAVGGEPTTAVYAHVCGHLREHLRRYPMILANVQPTGRPGD